MKRARAGRRRRRGERPRPAPARRPLFGDSSGGPASAASDHRASAADRGRSRRYRAYRTSARSPRSRPAQPPATVRQCCRAPTPPHRPRRTTPPLWCHSEWRAPRPRARGPSRSSRCAAGPASSPAPVALPPEDRLRASTGDAGIRGRRPCRASTGARRCAAPKPTLAPAVRPAPQGCERPRSAVRTPRSPRRVRAGCAHAPDPATAGRTSGCPGHG